MTRSSLLAAFMCFGLMTCGAANAAMITSASLVNSGTGDTYVATTTFTGNYFSIAGSVSGQYASPFSDNTSLFGVVQSGYAQYSFGGDYTSLSFVFGSPDAYNSVQFLKNGSQVDNLVSSSTSGSFGDGLSQLNNYVVTVSANSFDSVRFSSGSPAFEFANVAAISPVPLPASFPLFGGALLALGGLAFVKRQKKGSALVSNTFVSP